jgi:hypothetical protein
MEANVPEVKAPISNLFRDLGEVADIFSGPPLRLRDLTDPGRSLLAQALVITKSGNLQGGNIEQIDWLSAALENFISSRELLTSPDPLQASVITRLDQEVGFHEGVVVADSVRDRTLMKSDPLAGSIVALATHDRDLEEFIWDEILQLGDHFCFRLSYAISADATSAISRFVAEPKLFEDYLNLRGPVGRTAFFDIISNPYGAYGEFLRRNNPGKRVFAHLISDWTRPDILRHKPGEFEFYEIKALSPTGLKEGFAQKAAIAAFYKVFSFPYRPGSQWTPTEHIKLYDFIADGGEQLSLWLHTFSPSDGLIFWELCLDGDVVKYFNRVRLVAGILAILLALAQVILAAAETAIESGEIALAIASLARLVSSLNLRLPTVRLVSP